MFEISVMEMELHLMQGLGILLLMIANLAGRLLLQKLRINLSLAQANELEDVAEKSLSWALTQAQQLIAEKGWDHIEVKSAVLKDAAEYAMSRFPAVMKRRAKIAPGSSKLTGILERKLPAAMANAMAVTANLRTACPNCPGFTPPPVAPSAAPGWPSPTQETVHAHA